MLSIVRNAFEGRVMTYIKIIKSTEEHERALARLEFLMDAEPDLGSDEADELDVLALLIERYEQEQFPIDMPDPIEAIKFRMGQQGLSQKDLVPFMGSASKVSEVLSGKRKLSVNMIRKISLGLGISADILIHEPLQKMASSSEISWQMFPLAEMRKRSYFEGFSGSIRDLKEYAGEEVSRFLSMVPSGLSLQPTLLRSTSHSRSNDKETDEYALWAWQVRILQKAQEEPLSIHYQQGSVDPEFMRKLAQLSWSEKGPLLAKEFLNRNGIHLIIEPHLPKTYLDGAVCLNATGNPVIALTLRHDRLDNFWFTLMHELAHLELHIDSSDSWFIDDLDAESTDEMELEADLSAQKAFIPQDIWSNRQPYDSSTIQNLSYDLNISPCIIAGRLRYEKKDHKLFGRSFREKVRKHFNFL
jgi:HTH-type transcriptional regulator/antitoxin HigA